MEQVEQQAPQRSALRTFMDKHWFIVTIVITLLFALLLRAFVVQTVVVDGPSMEPTLYTDEILLVDKISYRFSAPKRQQVVVFPVKGLYDPDKTDVLVKRIIGIGGDTVEIKDGLVYVNGERIDDPHAKEAAHTDMPMVTVPEGKLFVMGDNRNRSSDSRVPQIGMIDQRDVIGRAFLIIWPIKQIQGI